MVVEYVPDVPIPRPFVDLDSQGFWDGVKQHKLVIQRCKDCHAFLFPPRPMCPHCLSSDIEWAPVSGKGSIYSWVTITYDKTGLPGMKVPYSVVLVELEEGIRLLSNVVDMKPDEIYIPMPVEVIFEDIAEDLTLYKFKRREEK